MEKTSNLTEGSIIKSLINLSLPIMGTSFIQMAYNMTDMIWVGRIGSKAVAAVGTAGFFLWFAFAFILISKIGSEVMVGQHIGKKDSTGAREFAIHSIQINIILAILYGIFLIVFKDSLIGFFNLGDMEVIKMAKNYLVIVSIGIPFYFINPVLTGIFNGAGDSRTPFIMNTIGLISNIILDPIFIFGIGIFEPLGVSGAAIATVLSQLIVTLCFIYKMKQKEEFYFKINLFNKPKLFYIKTIFKLGFPVALHNGLFTICSMILARIISDWGPTAIAVQKIGSQIESISWMTAGGISTALGAFVAQNYGAKKWDRIFKGYITTMIIAAFVGIFATILLVFFGDTVFSFFIQEKQAINIGIDYLKILGYSQLFMCIEIATAGAFNGLGKTTIPAVISILFNALRIPSAIFLAKPELLGLNGVWWSISISSIIKGILVFILFAILVLYKERYVIKSSIFQEKQKRIAD
jgi:putative MATE family efflux protein